MIEMFETFLNELKLRRLAFKFLLSAFDENIEDDFDESEENPERQRIDKTSAFTLILNLLCDDIEKLSKKYYNIMLAKEYPKQLEK